jgi:hypothetical protein
MKSARPLALGTGYAILVAAGAALLLVVPGCEDDQPACAWAPQVETNPDGSCLITTDSGETNCWGGITVTCVPNDGTPPDNATFDCQAEGESACGIPIELDQPNAPSCDYFLQEMNFPAYTDVWAECWDWETWWWWWY